LDTAKEPHFTCLKKIRIDGIENTQKGYISKFQGHTTLRVSFGGIKQGLGMPVFEFFNSISDIPCNKKKLEILIRHSIKKEWMRN